MSQNPNPWQEINKQQIAEIKQLLRDTFWQLDSMEDGEITPKLLRDFLRANIAKLVVREFSLAECDRTNFWQTVEKMVHRHLEVRANPPQKHLILLTIRVELEIEAERPALAEDEATDIAKERINQVFPDSLFVSIDAATKAANTEIRDKFYQEYLERKRQKSE